MSDINVLTGEVLPDGLTADQARKLTEQIATAIGATWQLVQTAYMGRAWVALGYGSWDDYCSSEFGQTRIRLPREERQEVVSSLRDAGLSIRAIAAATGDSKDTVHRALTGVSNETPALPPAAEPPAEEPPADPPPTITGTDGKSYKAKAPAKDLVDDLRENDDEAMRRHLHKLATTALVGFTEVRKIDPARAARALPDRDNARVVHLVDEVQAWLTEYRTAMAGADVTPLRRVK